MPSLAPTRAERRRGLAFRTWRSKNPWRQAVRGAQRIARSSTQHSTSELQHAGSWFLSLSLNLRAIVAVRRGNADEAISWAREGLTHIRAVNDKFAFFYTLVPLATAAALKGKDLWAARLLGAAMPSDAQVSR